MTTRQELISAADSLDRLARRKKQAGDKVEIVDPEYIVELFRKAAAELAAKP